VADIHGTTEKIIRIKNTIFRKKPDVLVIAGDITNFTFPSKTLEILNDILIPIFCIRGNTDLKPVERLVNALKNISLLGIAPVFFQDKKFLGLNGTIPLPFLSKICLGETQFISRLKREITKNTILVAHPPPRGVLDRVGNKFCAGNIGIKNLIEGHPPLLVICGHIHEQAGYQFFKNTWVVNCAMNNKFSGAIIDLSNDLPIKIKMVTNKGKK